MNRRREPFTLTLTDHQPALVDLLVRRRSPLWLGRRSAGSPPSVTQTTLYWNRAGTAFRCRQQSQAEEKLWWAPQPHPWWSTWLVLDGTVDAATGVVSGVLRRRPGLKWDTTAAVAAVVAIALGFLVHAALHLDRSSVVIADVGAAVVGLALGGRSAYRGMRRPRHTEEGYARQRALMVDALRIHFGAGVPTQVLVRDEELSAPIGRPTYTGRRVVVGYRDAVVAAGWPGADGLADRSPALRSRDTAEVLARLPDDVGFFFDDGSTNRGWTVPPAGWSAIEDR